MRSRPVPETARSRHLYLEEGGGVFVAQKWKDAIIMVFHEKKDRKERDNYKGVSLIAHAGKILLKTITRRLSEYCERVGNLPRKKVVSD